MISPNLLTITTQNAMIGINTTHGKYSIKQPKADMRMNIQHPKIIMSTEKPKVVIDQSQCFADAGLKNYRQLTQSFVQYAKQKVIEGISRRVRQGNELANTQNLRSTIAKQAEENAYEMFKQEFDIGTIPKHRPNIEVRRGKVDVQLKRGKVNIHLKTNKPEINYTRGKVNIYLRQRSSINIEYLGNKLDNKV